VTPMQRKLALYSDQELPGNAAMDERLIRLIGRPGPQIGYISAGPDPERRDFAHRRGYYAGIGADLTVYLDSDQAAANPDWAALLLCDAIHLSGGDTFGFLYWLGNKGVLPRLKQYVRDGGVLVGVSAGAILMTPSVTSATLCGDIRTVPLASDDALHLVDFHFWPHFNPDHIDASQADLASTLPNLYACPNGSGIIVDGAKMELFGKVSRYA
jgi:dipeptidase E